MRSRTLSALAAIGWFAFLGALFAGLLLLGSLLPIPTLDQASTWLIDTPVPVAALTFVRVCCLLGVGYLMIASVIAVVIDLAKIDMRVPGTDSIPVRRLMRNALGVSLAASALVPISPAAAAVDSRNYPVLHHVDPNASTTTTTTRPTTTTTTVAPTPNVTLVEPEQPAALETHTVVSGDSLWSIAATTLRIRLGHEGSPSEIADLVDRIGGANADVFVDPDNHDLIFPGQVFRLPPA